MTGRLLLAALALAQLGAAAVALGVPDLAAAMSFLGGGAPTIAESLAALRVLVLAIVAIAAAQAVPPIVFAAAPAFASRRAGEGMVLAAGLLLLITGLLHHAAGELGLSGGSVAEAWAAIGR
jgi:hypothetical protein